MSNQEKIKCPKLEVSIYNLYKLYKFSSNNNIDSITNCFNNIIFTFRKIMSDDSGYLEVGGSQIRYLFGIQN